MMSVEAADVSEARVGRQIARLESHVEHIQSDVTETRENLRRIGDKLDAVRDSIASAKIWAIGLYVTQAAVLLGVMARGFGWVR